MHPSENRFFRQIGRELGHFPEKGPWVVGGRIEAEPLVLSSEQNAVGQPNARCDRGPSNSAGEEAPLPVRDLELGPRIETVPG